MTAILGISAFYHDSAAALVVDGRIVAAAQEERFTGKKHDDRFPLEAITYCLEEAKLDPEALDYVGFYEKPLLTFGRLIETYLSFAPAGFPSFVKAMPIWLRQKLRLPNEMRTALGGTYTKRFVFLDHHESHAASAFFPSPFEEAAILTLDGVGEWATAAYGFGNGHRIELTHELRFPHSLGLLYSAFTYYCGFKVNGGEYKLMGLAPYGEPKYTNLIYDNLIDLKPDGSFRMDMSYFNYCQGLTMTSHKFDRLFGAPPRDRDAQLQQRDMDIAASIQRVTEEVMLRIAHYLHTESGSKNLCLAGGVALNCVGNGRILREGPFENIWIQPAAGDAGGALGVAQFVWHQLLGNRRSSEAAGRQQGSRLGIAYDDDQIESFLASTEANYRRIDDRQVLIDEIAEAIASGQVVGWFQDRMEFGPRALGARSILGDARNPHMQSIINQKVKFREDFRPFAPVVLAEHAHRYFDLEPGQESPYMLLVTSVREDKRLPGPAEDQDSEGLERLHRQRSVIPAVTHVDDSARVQTVDSQRHGLLHRLMQSFYTKTGCPVLVNTSFNLGWDPIVMSPRDAYRTFMASEIDLLCMGSLVVEKRKQKATLETSTRSASKRLLTGPTRCPRCRGRLQEDSYQLTCRNCAHTFAITDDIPQLFWPHESIEEPHDVTARVRAFYEDTPFPNYDEHDSLRSLIEKSRRGLYARRLDESIPYNSQVLEVGCGTGQLTNFLGLGCRRVVGSDLCLNSLRLGETFRKKHNIERVRFVQMNLFQPSFEPNSFDVVLCNGVLHHTADPRGGFERLVPLLKPGGYIIVGLYNVYGRLMTDLRRQFFRLTGNRGKRIDPILRNQKMSLDKRRAWFADQYQHPHESKHTFGEVLAWFESSGIQFVRGVPALRPDDDGLAGSSLFDPQSPGTHLDRFIAQLTEIFAGQKEGGYFLMIGRKPLSHHRESLSPRQEHHLDSPSNRAVLSS